MFNTVSVKEKYKEVFFCGDKDSKEVITIIGSCRVMPYVNYIDIYNKQIGNKYKIYCIDPINYHWDELGKDQDYEQALKELETDENFLSILKSTKIFIHEGLSSFRILNTLKTSEINIYQFGMNPDMDINIPNFHDVFILFQDYYNIDEQFRRDVSIDIEMYGEISETLQKQIIQKGDKHIRRFEYICSISSFPEMAEYFRNNYLKTRLFWTFNHVAKGFTLFIFRKMNEKFLKFNLPEAYWLKISREDMYETVFTPLCEYDIKYRNFEWNEDIVNFKEYNKL